jgi:hypothetical protein
MMPTDCGEQPPEEWEAYEVDDWDDPDDYAAECDDPSREDA